MSKYSKVEKEVEEKFQIDGYSLKLDGSVIGRVSGKVHPEKAAVTLNQFIGWVAEETATCVIDDGMELESALAKTFADFSTKKAMFGAEINFTQ